MCLQIWNKNLLQVSRLNEQKHNCFLRRIFYFLATEDCLVMEKSVCLPFFLSSFGRRFSYFLFSGGGGLFHLCCCYYYCCSFLLPKSTVYTDHKPWTKKNCKPSWDKRVRITVKRLMPRVFNGLKKWSSIYAATPSKTIIEPMIIQL